MKFKAIYFLLILFSLASRAQDVPDYKHELSINTTAFIANYFNLGGVTSNAPYLFDYKYKLADNLYFRSALDAAYVNNNSSQNSGLRTYFISKRFNTRIGIEARKQLATKWQWTYGADVTGAMSHAVTKSPQNVPDENNKATTVKRIFGQENNAIGAGVITGLRWQLSPRIAIWSEARLYLSYSEGKQINSWEDVTDSIRKKNPGFSFDKNTETSYTTGLNFFVPLDVFVTFRF